MLTLVYEEKGQNFTDFEIKRMQENKEQALALVKGKGRFSVSNGLFIRLVQVLIAHKYLAFDEVELEVDNIRYAFVETGQLKDSLPKPSFASLAYELTIEMIQTHKKEATSV